MKERLLDICHLGTCEDMSAIQDGSVDCVVTSPPYDKVRTYGGHGPFDVDRVAAELYRVLVDGGVVCWVVQDQTADFAKSDTSFEHVLRFKAAGFRRWETIVYHRHGKPGPWWATRLRVDHEYVHVFFKGDRPRAFTKPMVKSIAPGRSVHGPVRHSSGELKHPPAHDRIVAEEKCRGTVWEYATGGDGDSDRAQHPATFPGTLAADLIRAFSQEGDVILDPFMGSGTTAIEAEVLSRRWIGYEINPEYYALIQKRTAQRGLFSA